ncbi:MAG: MFS transporter [Alphaproteobacteria bacterium]|nr:MFS transporter [Alphaproteobacteria bacterium]
MDQWSGLARQRRIGATRLTQDQTRTLTNPWIVLTVLLMVSIFNFADRYLITGLIGPIKQEFGLGDAMMGLLMGPAFIVLYVVLGVPFARLADRYSRVVIIAGGCVLWSAATVATGMATGQTSLLVARATVGIGEAAFVAPAYSLLSDYFKPERRGIAFAILGLATYFGQIIGQAGGPALAAYQDWRFAFHLLGVLGIVLGVLTAMIVRDPGQIAPRGERSQSTIAMTALVALLARNASFVLMMFAFGLGALSGVAFGYWGPELLTRGYGLDPVAAKTAFAVNFGLAGLVGMLCFGAISDRMAKYSMAWPVRLSAFAMGSATCAILAATWADSFALAKLLAIPSGLLGGGWSVGIYATLQYILPARFRATATALFLAVTTLLAYFVGPWATGLLSEAFGNDAHSLRVALTIIIPIGLIATLFAWFASRRIELDRALIHKHA